MSANEQDSTRTAKATTDTASQPTLAQLLYTVETLVHVFGFSVDAANQAANEVGTDITACYNYILDQGLGKDTGGAIYPIEHCPHIYTAVTTKPENLANDIFHRACEYHSGTHDDAIGKKRGNLKEVSEENGSTNSCPPGENWLCLTCNQVFCSRYVNGHGLEHWHDTCRQDETGHCVAASLEDLSIWCHVCGAYLVHDEAILKPIVANLEFLKFPQE